VILSQGFLDLVLTNFLPSSSSSCHTLQPLTFICAICSWHQFHHVVFFAVAKNTPCSQQAFISNTTNSFVGGLSTHKQNGCESNPKRDYKWPTRKSLRMHKPSRRVLRVRMACSYCVPLPPSCWWTNMYTNRCLRNKKVYSSQIDEQQVRKNSTNTLCFTSQSSS
jgi:hypothetical protein